MAIASIYELWDGRSGEVDYTRKRTYTRIFEVYTTDPIADETFYVGSTDLLPALGESYPYDLVAMCSKITPKNDTADPLRWIVTCTYDTHPRDLKNTQPDGSNTPPGDIPDNPLDKPPEWKLYFEQRNIVLRSAYVVNDAGNNVTANQWGISGASWSAGVITFTTSGTNDIFAGQEITITGMTPVAYNSTYIVVAVLSSTQFTVTAVINPGSVTGLGIASRYGGGSVAIVNSAGIPFDPPVMYDVSDQCITIMGNVANVNLQALPLINNSLNLTTWKGFAPRLVRCIGVEAVTGWENNVAFWKLTYNFKVRADTWTIKVLDCGYGYYEWHQKILGAVITLDAPRYIEFRDPFGHPYAGPTPLNGAGARLPYGNPPIL